MKVFIIVICLVLCLSTTVFACTGIVVGKDASADGSLIMGRNEDIGAAYNKNFKVNAATAGEGTFILADPYNGFEMALPLAGCKWTMVSDVPEHDDGLYPEACMNEYGVSITATVSTSLNDAVMAADPTLENGLREAYLPSVVIPYVTTAREAVERLGWIIEEYGSAEGNTVIIADENEAWVMEIVSGHQWAAQKVPDDSYAVIPNFMMLGYIDAEDTENYLCSADLFTLPQEQGFLKTYKGQPHVALTYGADLSDGNRVRAWGGQHYFSASQNIPYDSDVFDIFMKPDEPITLMQAMDVLGYRYEGTEFDANTTGSRAIGTEGTSEAHLFQYRQGLPLVQWLSLGNPEHGLFLPSYVYLSQTPEAFHIEGSQYNADAAYWTFRGLSALAQLNRSFCGEGVNAYWDIYQQELIDQISTSDAEIMALDAQAAETFANELFADMAGDAMAKAETMYDELMYYICRNKSLTVEPRAPFVTSLMPQAAK